MMRDVFMSKPIKPNGPVAQKNISPLHLHFDWDENILMELANEFNFNDNYHY